MTGVDGVGLPQEFAVKWKVGDRPVVVEVRGVESRLFEDGSDRCDFEAGGNRAGLERSVDDVRYEG